MLGRLANLMLRPLGVELRHTEAARAEYTPCEPHRYLTYSPWLTPAFEAAQQEISGRTLVTADRRYVLETVARQAVRLPGAFMECGVYRGGTAYLLARLLQDAPRPLHLHDTFSGMPDFAGDDPSGHRSGDFGDTSLDSVRHYLRGYPFVEFHPGLIPQTFVGLPPDLRLALVHVDVDLHRSVHDVLTYAYPRVVPGGVMVVDDYGFAQYRDAARRAVDEFFAGRPEVPLLLRTGQCLITKL